MKLKSRELRRSRRRVARLKKRAAQLDDAALLDVLRLRAASLQEASVSAHDGTTGTADAGDSAMMESASG